MSPVPIVGSWSWALSCKFRHLLRQYNEVLQYGQRVAKRLDSGSYASGPNNVMPQVRRPDETIMSPWLATGTTVMELVGLTILLVTASSIPECVRINDTLGENGSRDAPSVSREGNLHPLA